MKIYEIIGIVSIILCILTGLLTAEQTTTFTSTDDDNLTFIPGLGAVVKMNEKAMTIEMIPPAADRAEECRAVDLKNGDEILMLNGKRIKSIDQFDELYTAIDTGDDVKFGIRRDGAMMIASYIKPKAEAGGQKIVMMTTTMGDAEPSADGGGQMKKMVIGGDGPGGAVPFLDAGLVLKDGDNGVTVDAVISNIDVAMTGTRPQEGDIITALQGTAITSTAEFMKQFAKIEIGAKVELTFSHGGVSSTAEFEKKKQEPAMIMKSH